MKLFTLFLSLMGLMQEVSAAQVKLVEDYEAHVIEVSINEPNTLVLEDDRLQHVNAPGNSLVDGCHGAPQCKLIDEVSGVLTFMPAAFYHDKVFTLNLITEKGHYYNLLIQSKPIASQTIVLKRLKVVNEVLLSAPPDNPMIALVQQLKAGTIPAGFKRQLVPKATYVFKRLRVKRRAVFVSAELTAELFELTNTANSPLVVNQALFKTKVTQAILINRARLSAHETTTLYRISAHD